MLAGRSWFFLLTCASCLHKVGGSFTPLVGVTLQVNRVVTSNPACSSFASHYETILDLAQGFVGYVGLCGLHSPGGHRREEGYTAMHIIRLHMKPHHVTPVLPYSLLIINHEVAPLNMPGTSRWHNSGVTLALSSCMHAP